MFMLIDVDVDVDINVDVDVDADVPVSLPKWARKEKFPKTKKSSMIISLGGSSWARHCVTGSLLGP